ncbi:MAG: DUF4292 domain-containing protein, partial [Bacteroidetes bacterium]|nr:DUF4292 domain-containing protein [Bacteroidota bacterium]MBU1718511.1 DUF4292 domain-containing protein [Bacteroidota bacterium]
DSLIWVSISPALGIEIARIMISNDSIMMINRLESTYFLGNFKFLNQMVNADFDFDMLQAFLTGNDFSYYENDKFKSSVDHNDKMYKLSTVGRRKLKKFQNESNNEPLMEDIWLDPETFKICRLKVNQFKENRKFEAHYSSFTGEEGSKYASEIEYDINAEEKVSIQLTYKSVTIDVPQTFPFTIPEKYSRSYY